jgi:hypothetical protein
MHRSHTDAFDLSLSAEIVAGHQQLVLGLVSVICAHARSQAIMEDDWHTVHTRTKDKKQRQKERQNEQQDEPASIAVATAANPFAEFDRAFADKAAQQQQQKANVFEELEVDEDPVAQPQDGAEEVGASSADEGAAVSAAAPARTAKKAKPKPKSVRKPQLTVAQVAAGKALGCHAEGCVWHTLAPLHPGNLACRVLVGALQPHMIALVQTTYHLAVRGHALPMCSA